jgi:SAM-dependent MidA family methyltransferase
MLTASNSLARILRDEIKQCGGAISFAQFMELALYCPDFGYYERKREIGKRGDFFTSVSVGSLFGELLAFQFAEWFGEGGTRKAERGKTEKAQLQIVEGGAHDGRLACDILKWLEEFRPKIFQQVTYYILERSEQHREWQRETLATFSGKIFWCKGWRDFPSSTTGLPHTTIVFCNELLDAMPVHRLRWDKKEKSWRELFVGSKGDRFIWLDSKGRRPSRYDPQQAAFKFAAQLLLWVGFKTMRQIEELLPDGFKMEISLAAMQWWKEAAQNIRRGKLLAIDYGFRIDELLVPEHSEGTLRSFFRHHLVDDVLANPGQQDITADVNFSALQNAGEVCSLQTVTFASQQKFLMQIVERILADPHKFGCWDARRKRQLQTLTHPEHLGRAFRVLMQERSIN